MTLQFDRLYKLTLTLTHPFFYSGRITDAIRRSIRVTRYQSSKQTIDYATWHAQQWSCLVTVSQDGIIVALQSKRNCNSVTYRFLAESPCTIYVSMLTSPLYKAHSASEHIANFDSAYVALLDGVALTFELWPWSGFYLVTDYSLWPLLYVVKLSSLKQTETVLSVINQ